MFWFIISSCQDVFGATNNIPAITTDHATRYYLDFLAVKTLKNVISLIGNLASSVMYIYFCLMVRL